jgi:hypothetical protein
MCNTLVTVCNIMKCRFSWRLHGMIGHAGMKYLYVYIVVVWGVLKFFMPVLAYTCVCAHVHTCVCLYICIRVLTYTQAS